MNNFNEDILRRRRERDLASEDPTDNNISLKRKGVEIREEKPKMRTRGAPNKTTFVSIFNKRSEYMTAAGISNEDGNININKTILVKLVL